MTEYRPCPICHGTRSDECTACQGEGRFPYPWILPDDPPIRQEWTAEEDDVIRDAPSGPIARERYCAIYGEMERSYSSVYRHWQYINGYHTARCPHWSEDEIDILTQALDCGQAVYDYLEAYGTQRTIKAIRAKYARLS